MANYVVKLSPTPKGHEIPPLLQAVGTFIGTQRHGALGWFDALAVEPIPKEWNEEEAARLRAHAFGFLSLPEGSLLALLKTGEKAPAAVVLLGSEGEARTVANSLEEFLTLWSKGETDIGELDDEEGASGRRALKAWLAKNKVKAPKVKVDFDFEAWLDSDAPPAPAKKTAASPAVVAKSAVREVPAVKGLGPKLGQLASIVGMRADAPQVVAYVTKVLGKKVPQSTSERTASADISAPKAGVEMVFSHDILNEAYPPIPKTGKTFIPYVQVAWVTEKFIEPVLGVPWTASEKEVTAILGAPQGKRPLFTTDNKPTIPYWTRDLGRGVTLDLSFRDRIRVELMVESAGYLEQFADVTTALFLGWAATRGLLDESRFAEHVELLAAVKKRKAKGSDLLAAALPRGLWDVHLKDSPDLRITAYRWFHNLKGPWITGDLKKVFGKRSGANGHDEPKLDDDTWDAVDKAAAIFETRFARWIQ